MSKGELLDLIRTARLRLFGCPRHGRMIQFGQCAGCIIEERFGVDMEPTNRMLLRTLSLHR